MKSNEKLMLAIGQFIDANYLSAYTVEGYFGFAYLHVETFNTDTMERETLTWNFDIDPASEEVVMSGPVKKV